MPSVAASHTRCAASYATTGSLARSDGPGRGDESETPGSRPVLHVAPPSRRRGEADGDRSSPERAPVLKHGDDGRAERERVGLGLRRVLTDRVARAVARDLSGDDLAVALDDVCRVGRDDVAAGAAADAVARPVTVSRDAVVALAACDVSRPGPPTITSAPESPSSVSLPARPSSTSARGVPLRTSALGVPVTVAADARPASSAPVVRAAARRSMTAKVAGTDTSRCQTQGQSLRLTLGGQTRRG